MFESLRNCHFRFTCKMNMEVFEAADKVAAVSGTELQRAERQAGAGAGAGAGAADADLLYTKLAKEWRGQRKDEPAQTDRSREGDRQTDRHKGAVGRKDGRTEGRTDSCV